MKIKVCTKCGKKKELGEFNKCSASKDGYGYRCKCCKKEHNNEYYKKNKDKRKAWDKEYYKKNKDKIRVRGKGYRKKNKDKIKVCNKEYYKKNKDKRNACHKEYYKKNEDKIKKYIKRYREKNKDKLKEHFRKRLENDFMFRFVRRVSRVVSLSFDGLGYKKRLKIERIIGLSFEGLGKWIENQLPKETSLGSFVKKGSGWSIDHYIPWSRAKTREVLIKLNNYRNLRPMLLVDNIVKRNKLPSDAKEFIKVLGIKESEINWDEKVVSKKPEKKSLFP